MHLPDEDVLEPLRGRWTSMLDVLAQVVRVRAAVVVRFDPDDGASEVFASSRSDGSPYQVGARLAAGRLWEDVVTTSRRAMVEDAAAELRWSSSPDVELGMRSCLASRATAADGTPFGAICLLDERPRRHTELDTHLLEQFRLLVEQDLAALERERDLRRNEANLEAAQRIAHVGNWTWEIARGEINWTDEVYRIFGYEPGDFEPTYAWFLECIHPDDRDAVTAAVAEALAGSGHYTVEHRVVRPDGDVRHVQEVGEVARDADGEAISMLGTVQDITARRLAEIEVNRARAREEHALQQALDAEREAARRSREIDELKSRFLSAVSHELRTPVTVVEGFAEMLRDRWAVLPPDIAEMALERMQSNAVRLSRLVQSVLELDRLTHGAERLHPSAGDVEALVRASASRFEGRDHPVSVTVAPVPGVFDRAKVEQIVEVLVGNAVEHTPAGTEVSVSLTRRHDGAALLEVADSGPGVPDDLKSSVFDPFSLGDTDRAATRGMGIGLTLVARFAELHGGRAWVEDRAGGGARFLVLLRPISATEDG